MRPPRRRIEPAAFSVRASLAFAKAALAQPPALPHIERPDPIGELVAEFVLPLELCKPFNRIGRAGTASAGWALGKLKQSAYLCMWQQAGGRRANPLPGRPHILCCRFSSVEPDHDSGWTKNPVDRLRVGKNGLGFIVDDKPRSVKLSAWWEPAPPRQGFVLVGVFTGERHA